MIFQDATVPLFRLTEGAHILIVWFAIPIFGSILTALLFPRIFTPLFLAAKRKIYFRYDDKYLDIEPAALTKRMFIIRAIYTLLLTMGIMSFILPIIDPHIVMPEYLYQQFVDRGIEPLYGMANILTVIGLILPIVVGLWSIGWVMEDAGLMHYRLDDRRPGKLYEIEPIHIKYNSYLKGYAGIAAILFIIGVSLHYTQVIEGRENVIIAYLIPFFSILLSMPAYYVYAKVMGNNSFLRKGLKEIKKFSNEDVIKD
jgi:hypothetical protein